MRGLRPAMLYSYALVRAGLDVSGVRTLPRRLQSGRAGRTFAVALTHAHGQCEVELLWLWVAPMWHAAPHLSHALPFRETTCCGCGTFGHWWPRVCCPQAPQLRGGYLGKPLHAVISCRGRHASGICAGQHAAAVGHTHNGVPGPASGRGRARRAGPGGTALRGV